MGVSGQAKRADFRFSKISRVSKDVAQLVGPFLIFIIPARASSSSEFNFHPRMVLRHLIVSGSFRPKPVCGSRLYVSVPSRLRNSDASEVASNSRVRTMFFTWPDCFNSFETHEKKRPSRKVKSDLSWTGDSKASSKKGKSAVRSAPQLAIILVAELAFGFIAFVVPLVQVSLV